MAARAVTPSPRRDPHTLAIPRIVGVVLGLDGLTRFVQHHLQPTKVTHRRTEENLRREMPRVVLEELVRPRPVGVPILVCDPS